MRFNSLAIKQKIDYASSLVSPSNESILSTHDLIAHAQFLELKYETSELQKYLERPETFSEAFCASCRERAIKNQDTSFDLLSNPDSISNDLYLSIALSLFQPKGIKELLAILMPDLKEQIMLYYDEPEGLPNMKPRELRRLVMLQATPSLKISSQLDFPEFSNGPVYNESLIKEQIKKELINYIVVDGKLFDLRNLAGLNWIMHQKLHALLQSERGNINLAKAIYNHNSNLRALGVDLVRTSETRRTPKSELLQLISGLRAGGSNKTGLKYATPVAGDAITHFLDYLDLLPSEAKTALRSLNEGMLGKLIDSKWNNLGCVESTALQLEKLFITKNAAILNENYPLDNAKIANKYRSLGEKDRLATSKGLSESDYIIPSYWVMPLLGKINWKNEMIFVDFIKATSEKDYPQLMSWLFTQKNEVNFRNLFARIIPGLVLLSPLILLELVSDMQLSKYLQDDVRGAPSKATKQLLWIFQNPGFLGQSQFQALAKAYCENNINSMEDLYYLVRIAARNSDPILWQEILDHIDKNITKYRPLLTKPMGNSGKSIAMLAGGYKPALEKMVGWMGKDGYKNFILQKNARHSGNNLYYVCSNSDALSYVMALFEDDSEELANMLSEVNQACFNTWMMAAQNVNHDLFKTLLNVAGVNIRKILHVQDNDEVSELCRVNSDNFYYLFSKLAPDDCIKLVHCKRGLIYKLISDEDKLSSLVDSFTDEENAQLLLGEILERGSSLLDKLIKKKKFDLLIRLLEKLSPIKRNEFFQDTKLLRNLVINDVPAQYVEKALMLLSKEEQVIACQTILDKLSPDLISRDNTGGWLPLLKRRYRTLQDFLKQQNGLYYLATTEQDPSLELLQEIRQEIINQATCYSVKRSYLLHDIANKNPVLFIKIVTLMVECDAFLVEQELCEKDTNQNTIFVYVAKNQPDYLGFLLNQIKPEKRLSMLNTSAIKTILSDKKTFKISMKIIDILPGTDRATFLNDVNQHILSYCVIHNNKVQFMRLIDSIPCSDRARFLENNSALLVKILYRDNADEWLNELEKIVPPEQVFTVSSLTRGGWVDKKLMNTMLTRGGFIDEKLMNTITSVDILKRTLSYLPDINTRLQVLEKIKGGWSFFSAMVDSDTVLYSTPFYLSLRVAIEIKQLQASIFFSPSNKKIAALMSLRTAFERHMDDTSGLSTELNAWGNQHAATFKEYHTRFPHWFAGVAIPDALGEKTSLISM